MEEKLFKKSAIETVKPLDIKTGIVSVTPNGASGSLSYTVPENGTSYKKFMFYFDKFSFNNNFNIGFLYTFSKVAEITSDTVNIITSNDLTSITFYPIPGKSYDGVIVVEGY